MFGLFCLLPIHDLRAQPMAVDASRCLTAVQADIGTVCGSDNSLEVKMVNNCNITVRAQLCLRAVDHRWSQCGSSNLKPGDSIYQYVCNSDGVMTTGGARGFPTIQVTVEVMA